MKSELKQAFSSPLFFLALAVLFLCLQGYSIPVYYQQWLSAQAEPLELRESAFTMTLGGIFFGGVLLLLPFCAAIAYAPSQVDELRSSVMNWSMLRSSVRTYTVHKVIAAFLCGAASAGVAFTLHAVLWHILALPYDPTLYPNHLISFYEESFFNAWVTIHHALPIIVEIGVGITLTAGIWSVVALATAVWVPDKLLVAIIPACIYYLWSANLTYYLFGFRLPSPGAIFNDAQTLQGDLICIIAYCVLLAIAVTVYYFGIKRRACNA